MTDRYEVPVRFQDIDAAGVMFFARFFEVAHDAYVHWLASGGVHLHEVLAEQRWAAPLTHAEADFHSPARMGELLSVEVRSTSTKGSDLILEMMISGPSRPLAVIRTVHTFIDPVERRRIEVPGDIHTLLDARRENDDDASGGPSSDASPLPDKLAAEAR